MGRGNPEAAPGGRFAISPGVVGVVGARPSFRVGGGIVGVPAQVPAARTAAISPEGGGVGPGVESGSRKPRGGNGPVDPAPVWGRDSSRRVEGFLGSCAPAPPVRGHHRRWKSLGGGSGSGWDPNFTGDRRHRGAPGIPGVATPGATMGARRRDHLEFRGPAPECVGRGSGGSKHRRVAWIAPRGRERQRPAVPVGGRGAQGQRPRVFPARGTGAPEGFRLAGEGPSPA